MEKNKERIKITLMNLIIMSFGSMLLVLLVTGLKYGFSFYLDDYLDRLIFPLFFSITICIGIWFRMKYELKEINSSYEKEIEQLHSYLSDCKSIVTTLTDESKIYQFRNSISLVKIRILITDSDDTIKIVAPNAVLKEIFNS